MFSQSKIEQLIIALLGLTDWQFEVETKGTEIFPNKLSAHNEWNRNKYQKLSIADNWHRTPFGKQSTWKTFAERTATNQSTNYQLSMPALCYTFTLC